MTGDEWTGERDRRLRAHLLHAYAQAPAVRALLDRAGVDPRAIRGLSDLGAVPVTTKDDLVRLQAADPPFGGFCAVPVEELGRVFVSPGPLYEPGAADRNGSDAAWLHALLAAYAVPRRARALVSFAYHLVPAGLALDAALRGYGLTVVPAGVGNTEVQVRALRDLAVEVFCGTPPFLVALAQRAEELGYRWGHELKLRYGVLGGDAFTPGVRAEIAARGITPIQTYGTADVGLVGCTCPQSPGFHLSDRVAVEIVDPLSGDLLPPGHPGEVVVTAFNRAYPLLRFGTGDVAALLADPCPCGLPSPVLSPLLGRVGQAVKVRGMFVHPGQVDEALRGVEGIGRYQVAVRRREERDELVVRVEVGDGDGAGVAARVGRRAQGVWRVRPDRVETVPVGSLPEGGKVLVDERPWDG